MTAGKSSESSLLPKSLVSACRTRVERLQQAMGMQQVDALLISAEKVLRHLAMVIGPKVLSLLVSRFMLLSADVFDLCFPALLTGPPDEGHGRSGRVGQDNRVRNP